MQVARKITINKTWVFDSCVLQSIQHVKLSMMSGGNGFGQKLLNERNKALDIDYLSCFIVSSSHILCGTM